MNEIRLNKLTLKDFQGGNFVLDIPKGSDAFIFGANATGKTRLVSAFTWLLFNKDALGRSDFEIKNLDDQGEAAHGLEHTVEGELNVNRRMMVLKKVFKEKWTKKRGNVNREFSGHTAEYWIDGVPIQEKDYISRIAEIAGDEARFRLLTSPMTFPSLHWQKQRQLLLDICGDVLDEDVISSNPKLAPLMDLLGKMRTLDDHRKIVTARRSEINKEMERIPIRIDEVRRGIPDVTGIDRGEAEKEAQRLETALNDAKLRLQGVNTGGTIADLTKKLSGLNADKQKMEEAHRSGSLATLNRLNQQISEVEVLVNTSRRKITSIEGELRLKDSQKIKLDAAISRLREQWTAIDAEIQKDVTYSTVCPTCGRALPTDQIQAAREKAIASFNESKAERLGEVDRKGKDLREQRDRIHGEIEAGEKEIEVLAKALLGQEINFNTLTQDRDTIKRSSEDFMGIKGYCDILAEIDVYNDEIKAEREGKAQDVEKIKGEISLLQQKHAFVMDRITMLNLRVNGENRIEELKADEKKLAAEFEKLEGELYLIEQFIKTKVSMLTDRINGKFQVVRFKLFNILINGGIEDCCEITVNGVPYNAGLNNAARIQAGCDIIRTLQEYYQMKAPVFVDNREAVTELPALNCQLISLVVSPEDKTLRVEV